MSLLLFVIFGCFGAVMFSTCFANGHRDHFIYDHITQNISEAAPEERTVVVSGAIAVGTILVSLWSSIFTERAVEIDLSNQMTSTLNDPTWYMHHGYVVMLPPFQIKENEPSTKVAFQRKKNAAVGTEGVLSYQIGPQRTHSLVVLWKVPQVTAQGFFVMIKKGSFQAEQLEGIFNNADEKQLWYHPEKLHQWQTRTEEGITWKAAMGTRSITSLKVVISK